MTDKPGKVFNLDALEQEARPEPFEFAFKGQRYVVKDPQDLDWRVTASMGRDPVYSLRELLGKDQFAKFSGHKHVPDWRVGGLLEAIGEHYGIGSPGEDEDSSGS